MFYLKRKNVEWWFLLRIITGRKQEENEKNPTHVAYPQVQTQAQTNSHQPQSYANLYLVTRYDVIADVAYEL